MRDLKRAADLVAAGWAQHEEAVAKGGRPVPPGDPEAAAWCLIGSMRHVAEIDEERMEDMLRLVHNEMLRRDGLNELEYWGMCEHEHERYRVIVEELVDFNDDVDRLASEVEDLLRSAAEDERTRYAI